jgi:ATP-dependent Lhr-like helicase
MTINFIKGPPPPEEETMKNLRPCVAQWFKEKFGEMTPPQTYAIPLIHENKSTLIFSPTGSGKTLAAFLSMIDMLYAMGERGELQETVYVLYVSPLRALNNDIKRNLMVPLEGIRELSRKSDLELPVINVAVRTGDTPQSERSKMLRHPPHILITTPETLAIVLTSPKFSQKLKTIKWVIVDEIHELCDSKRGVHLSLSLERLQHLVGEDKEFIRVGCSATQAPVEEIAKFLVGYRDDGSFRDCNIVDVYSTKSLDIRVTTPVSNLAFASYDSATDKMYEFLKDQIDSHTTTLIFTNTRSGTERIAFRLKELYGDENVDHLAAHHGSLSRDTRLDVEDRLKRGLLRAAVSSTSLELGIDIGYIDLVCQIGSPKSVAKGLQRIGRAGHALHETSIGRLVVFDLDDLVECTVLVRSAYDGKIDRVAIPRNCLDVLAQHLVGMSIESRWTLTDAYQLIKRSYCYHDLPNEDFMGVLKYLAGEHVSLEERGVYRKIWFDEEQQIFGRKRGSRMIYYLNIGTIPEEANYRVLLEEYRNPLGQLSESFVERLQPGDIFVLGGRAFEFRRTSGMRVYVRPAFGRRPTVPSWTGEMLPRSFDLSCDIGRFRQTLADKIRKDGIDATRKWLLREYRIDEGSVESILVYFRNQLAITGTVPTDKRVMIEGYIDKKSRLNIVFHSVYGRRVNDALSRAYAYAISRMVKANVGTAILDDGFVITLPAGRMIDLGKISSLVTPGNFEEFIRKAIRKTELFKQRFRHCAVRSFMVLRMYKGWEISVSRQQARSVKVLDLLEETEDFPVVKETYREILEDVMDLPNAMSVIKGINTEDIEFRVLPLTDVPSPFSHSLILVGAEDVVLMEDREALLRELHRQVLSRVVGEAGESLFSENTAQTLYNQRQHLTPETQGKTKEDILPILHDIGPVEMFRDTYPTILNRMAVEPEIVKNWSEELIDEGRVIIIRTPKGELQGVTSSDFTMYYHVYRSSPSEQDELEKNVLKALEERPLKSSELLELLKVKLGELRRALRKLERAMLVVRSKYSLKGSHKEENLETTWNLLSKHLPKPIFAKLETVDPEDRREEAVKQLLWSLGPCVPSEVGSKLNMPEDDAEKILKRLERMGIVFSGYFLPSKPPNQYLLAEDRELLRQLEKTKEPTRIPEIAVTQLVLEKQHLTSSTRGKGEDGIVKIVGELGPIQTHRALYHRIENFDIDSLRRLWGSEKRIVVGRFTERGLSYIRTDDLPIYIALHETNRSNLSDIDKIILNTIERENPIGKGRIIALTGFSKSTVEESLQKLEESLLTVRTTPYEMEMESQPLVLYEPVENYNYQVQKIARSEALRTLVLRVIEGQGLITIQGIIALTNLPYDEVESTLSTLRKEGMILSGQFIEGIPIETYVVARDLQRLKEIAKDTGERDLRDNEAPFGGKIIVDILSNLDPFTWRVAQQLTDLYGSAYLNPIVVDGELLGAADVRVTQDLLHVADLKISDILFEKPDLVKKIGARFIDIASYYGLMAAEVELIWGQPAVSEKNEKIVKVFTELGYEIVGDRLCWGETPSEIFDEQVVREFQFRKQHVHPETRGRTKEDVYKILQDLGGVWTPWEDKLNIRVEGLRKEWVEELIKKDRLLLEDTLLGLRSMLVPVKDWSTDWWASKTPLKLSEDAFRLLDIIKWNSPISKKVLIRKSMMHELDVDHLLSTLTHMRMALNIGSVAQTSIWVPTDQWFPSTIRLEEYVEPHEARRRIISRVLGSLGPLTVSQLRELTGFHSRQVRLVLTELKDQGRVGLGRFLKSPRTQIQFVTLEDLDELHSLASKPREEGYKRITGALTVPPGDPLYYALKDEIKSMFRIGWCYTIVIDGSMVAALKMKGAKKTHFIISDLLTLEKNADDKEIMNGIIDQIDETARSVGSIDIELKQINSKAIAYEGNQHIVESFKQRGYKAGGLVLYKAFSMAVQPSGKEVFAEDVCREFLMRRQHLSPQCKAKGKEGILRILHDIGRVHWSDSLALRTDRFNPNDLDELELRDRKIIHGRFLSEGLTMVPTDELLDYYYASRPPSLILGYDDERILEALTKSGPLDEKELSEKTNQDGASIRRSIENVEKAARVIKIRRDDSLYSSDGWLYDVVDHYLPKGAADFENISPKDARKRIISKFLGANGPVSLKQIEEWSHMELAEVKSTLSELEAEGRIASNVYIEGVSGRRYVRKEDLPELRMLEELYLSQKLGNGTPFYVTLPDSDPVVKTWKDELLTRFTIGLIELGADYYTLTLKSGSPVAAMQVHYEMNTLRIHDVEILGDAKEETIQAIIKEIEGTARESRKLEIQIEHITGRGVTDKLNKQQLDRFIKDGYRVTKEVLHKKL